MNNFSSNKYNKYNKDSYSYLSSIKNNNTLPHNERYCR